MQTQHIAGVALQLILVSAWASVTVFTCMTFLRFRRMSLTATGKEVAAEVARTRKAFFAFLFVFLPALVAWLPIIGTMESTDPLYPPVVLMWLVILMFGSIQFHVSLIPGRAVMNRACSLNGAETLTRAPAGSSAPSQELRRNV